MNSKKPLDQLKYFIPNYNLITKQFQNNLRIDKNKIKKGLFEYSIESLALSTVRTPICALSETFISGMSSNVSLDSRIYGSMLLFIGTTKLYNGGRSGLRNYLKITDSSPEKHQIPIDFLYYATFTGILSPILYTISGANTQEIINGTLTALFMSPILGPAMGYSLDINKDLFQIKETRRLPKKIKNLSKKKKKILATSLIALSLSLTAGVYEIKNNFKESNLYSASKLNNLTQKLATLIDNN